MSRLMTRTYADAIDESRRSRSALEWAPGRWLACGLKAHDEADAARIVASFAADEDRAQQRRHDARTPHLGMTAPSGVVWSTEWVDGELMARTIRVDIGAAQHLELVHDTTVASTLTLRPVEKTVRLAARWISQRRGPISTPERDAHLAIRALTPLVAAWPIPPAPADLLAGPETAAGAITLGSLIEPGWTVWSHHDYERATTCSADERRDGGMVLAVSTHATGRVLTVMREGVAPIEGGVLGLRISHLQARDVHWCETDECWSCPSAADSMRRAAKLWRRVHASFAIAPGRRGPLTAAEAVMVNAATTLGRIAGGL